MRARITCRYLDCQIYIEVPRNSTGENSPVVGPEQQYAAFFFLVFTGKIKFRTLAKSFVFFFFLIETRFWFTHHRCVFRIPVDIGQNTRARINILLKIFILIITFFYKKKTPLSGVK